MTTFTIWQIQLRVRRSSITGILLLTRLWECEPAFNAAFIERRTTPITLADKQGVLCVLMGQLGRAVGSEISDAPAAQM